MASRFDAVSCAPRCSCAAGLRCDGGGLACIVRLPCSGQADGASPTLQGCASRAPCARVSGVPPRALALSALALSSPACFLSLCVGYLCSVREFINSHGRRGRRCMTPLLRPLAQPRALSRASCRRAVAQPIASDSYSECHHGLPRRVRTGKPVRIRSDAVRATSSANPWLHFLHVLFESLCGLFAWRREFAQFTRPLWPAPCMPLATPSRTFPDGPCACVRLQRAVASALVASLLAPSPALGESRARAWPRPGVIPDGIVSALSVVAVVHFMAMHVGLCYILVRL